MTITESIDTSPGDEVDGDSSHREPRPALRLDLGVFTGLAVTLVGLGFGASRISDNSFLTHLATGREMLDSGVVRNDVFTWTSGGEGVVVQSWLASFVYAVIDDLAGFHGLRIFTALLAALLAAMAWHLTRASDSIVTRVAIMVPFLAVGHVNWTERPLLIAFALFAAMMLVVEGEGRPRWLLVAGAAWVNIHGSWPLALVYLASRALGGALDRDDVRTEVRTFGYLGVGMLVGGVVNPYGPSMLLFPLDLLGRQEVLSNIVEWQSPSFDSMWTRAFLVLVLGSVAALMRSGRWRDALPAIVFIAAALVGRRNIALASLVLLPVLAHGLPSIGRLTAARTSDAIRLGCAAVAVMLFVIPIAAISGPHVDVERYPENAFTAMEDELGLVPGNTRIIHQDFVGNYLDIRYGDAGATWIDDRFELHDASLVEDYLTLLDGGPEWNEVLERYDAEAIVWPREGVLTELATGIAGWSEVWSDDDWVVLCAPGHPSC
ncbi:MAG: hypothetical protein R2707_03195 [Acidimicrobiales bacterium]